MNQVARTAGRMISDACHEGRTDPVGRGGARGAMRAAAALARRAWRQQFRPPAKHWVRIVMNREIRSYLDALPCAQLDAAEVSGGTHRGRSWRSYVSLRYPGFDLCDPGPIDRTYDVVFCEQVLEHVPDPWRAVRTLRDLCAPGGRVVVSTPFLIKIHPSPDDFWRFTPHGLAVLLEGAGFEVPEVRSWGNRPAVVRNLRDWAPHRPWRTLREERDLPLVVWAFARAPAAPAAGPGSGAGPPS
jgi:SAM-dependent methyltransferase